MPNMQVGQRVLISAVGSYFGQRTITSWLYKVTAAAANTLDNTYFSALDAQLNGIGGLLTRFRDCVPGTGQWQGVWTWYQVLGPLRFRKLQYPLDDGAYVEVSDTANVQASITRQGEFATRRNIGGIRVPIASRSSVEGLLDEDIKVALNLLANEMQQDLVTVTPAVTMIPQVGVPGYDNAVPPVLIPVTDSLDLDVCLVQDTTRVIRRRTLRVGE